MTRSKSKAIKVHAYRRFGERLGWRPGEIRALERRIRDGELEIVHRQSNRVVHYLVREEPRIVAVYDRKRKLAVTVLVYPA